MNLKSNEAKELKLPECVDSHEDELGSNHISNSIRLSPEGKRSTTAAQNNNNKDEDATETISAFFDKTGEVTQNQIDIHFKSTQSKATNETKKQIEPSPARNVGKQKLRDRATKQVCNFFQ